MGLLYIHPSISEDEQKDYERKLMSFADDMFGGKVFSSRCKEVLMVRTIGISRDKRFYLLIIEYPMVRTRDFEPNKSGDPRLFGTIFLDRTLYTNHTKGCYVYGDVEEEDLINEISFETYLRLNQEQYQKILDDFNADLDDDYNHIVGVYVFG